jgi:hypothetical protein
MVETCGDRAAWAVRPVMPAALLVDLPLLASKHWATACRSGPRSSYSIAPRRPVTAPEQRMAGFATSCPAARLPERLAPEDCTSKVITQLEDPSRPVATLRPGSPCC